MTNSNIRKRHEKVLVPFLYYFKNKEHDFDTLFYLQRIIGATANKQIYSIIDTSYFVKDREKYYINNEKTIDKKKVI